MARYTKRKPGRPVINLKGMRFGRFVVQKRDRVAGYRACSYWYCLCDCGRRQSVRSSYLRWNILTQCYDCAIRKLKKKWKKMREQRSIQIWSQQRRRIRRSSQKAATRIPIRKKFTPTNIDDQIKEIIFLRSTGTPVKDISDLLGVPPEMTRDVLKNKAMYQKSLLLKKPRTKLPVVG